MIRRNAAAAVVALMATAAAAQEPRPRAGTLKVGEAAPVFELTDPSGKATVKLAELKGKPVVLVFGSCT